MQRLETIRREIERMCVLPPGLLNHPLSDLGSQQGKIQGKRARKIEIEEWALYALHDGVKPLP
jgi:hypothetical protein